MKVTLLSAGPVDVNNNRMPRLGLVATLAAMVTIVVGAQAPAEEIPDIDLSLATIVVSGTIPVHVKAAEMLQEEVFKRTGIRLERSGEMPGPPQSAIVLRTMGGLPEGAPQPPGDVDIPAVPESYRIRADTSASQTPVVHLTGSDDRGLLFAVGRLLRLLGMSRGRLSLPKDTLLSSFPRYPIRGHELGYRHLSNTYDAWDLERYERYIRDLVVFGANTVVLIPSLEAQLKDSPHMGDTVCEMTQKLVQMVASYGLDVWLYLPLLEDIRESDVAEKSLGDRRALFEKCSAIHAVFVPGGDPGNTPPELLLPWLKELGRVLRESHPEARLWLSNEDFKTSWNDYLFAYLQREQPEWLTGVVFGTWTQVALREQRARIPARYPIVQYPDITHCIECQYPVPNWDRAFARTLGREPVNPRPGDTAHTCRLLTPLSKGFFTYSDGANDDVNKIVWTALGWDPETEVETVLHEYGRYFVGEEYGDAVAEGLLALERNWRGPLDANDDVEATLDRWHSLEKEIETGWRDRSHPPGTWRFQMGLFRACYDAYVRRRLILEEGLERKALEELRRAREVGVANAIRSARETLIEVDRQPPAPELRQRIEELGEGLFESIGLQLSVDRYGAKNWERGAVLDFLDEPLNDRVWLEMQFAEILAATEEGHRLDLLERIVNWEDPGPGGFYDDLGNSAKEPHLVREVEWESDPGFVESPQDEFIEIRPTRPWRLSWLDQAQTLYGTPLRMRYEGLDPGARYRLRVTYTGRFAPTLRLVADGNQEIHGPLPQPESPRPLEFEVLVEATRDGTLDLEWRLVDGRGIQVAEVWLVRHQEK